MLSASVSGYCLVTMGLAKSSQHNEPGLLVSLDSSRGLHFNMITYDYNNIQYTSSLCYTQVVLNGFYMSGINTNTRPGV